MNELIVENIERISDHFGLDLREGNKCYLGCCPIHGGDNPTALNFYHVKGHSTVGNWQCQTQGCEEHFGKNAIGFIRGLLSAQKYNWSKGSDETVSFQDATKWCEDFFGIKYTGQVSKDNLSSVINRLYEPKNVRYDLNITNQQYLNSGLQFPDEYFLHRGYSQKTLKEFGVGFCNSPQKPMYSRAVVPLHNKNGNKIIGCSGRIIWNKCNICNCFHNPKSMCPTKEKKHRYPKWKNSKQFPGNSELYNFHRAHPLIETTGIAILTEGQPNIWRLFEAGFPMSLGCFGSNFSTEQKKVLDSSGAHTIIIVPDADEASKKFTEKIIKACKHSYNIVTIEPSYDDDIGACNIETVEHILSPFIEKYKI